MSLLTDPPTASFARRCTAFLLLGAASCVALAQPPEKALELRDRGFALLENEKPAEAEEVFRQLIEVYPSDPLGYANLAIARLRQEDTAGALAAINQAESKARGRADLAYIRAEIVAWIPNPEAALEFFATAAEAAPDDPLVQYALYRHSEQVISDRSTELGQVAAARLAKLRPENLVVLLARGQAALETGDRSAASETYLRLRELTTQLSPERQALVSRTLPPVLDALEADDLATARRASLRLIHAYRGATAWHSSLSEIFRGINVRGEPVARFANEPSTALPAPGKVKLEARSLHDRPGDVLAELFVEDKPLHVVQASTSAAWLTPLDAGATPRALKLPEGLEDPELLSIDLDNDGFQDVLLWSATARGVWQWPGTADGLGEPTVVAGLESIEPASIDALDFDSEGDLDLAILTRSGALELYRNSLEGSLERAAEGAFPTRKYDPGCVVSADVDADGDTDLLVASKAGLHWLDNNRQGTFSDRPGGLDSVKAKGCVAVGDSNNDGAPDLLVETADGLRLLLQNQGTFRPATQQPTLTGPPHWVDLDNDGRLDIVGPRGATQQTESGWRSLSIEDEIFASDLVPADRDGDGDLDLIAVADTGLSWLENEGGSDYNMLSVRLLGLTEGNSKNNVFGRGTSLETRIGASYQYREVRGPITHFGLGPNRRADVLRAVWANGVPQNRFDVETSQLIVEEQVLKGSCPFLYTWNGEQIEFVTDLLWGAPLGMPVAPGAWAPSDPRELVAVTGAVPRRGAEGSYYDLRITEELWEAAYFDTTKLWIVDAPEDVEVLSTLRVFPGEKPAGHPGGASLVGVSNLRPVVHATDGQGRDVTERVARRDEVYADGYPVGDYQGVAAKPWTFTFDLGETPTGPFRLLLDGWIFPADASLNLAAAQRSDLDFTFTRLEVRDGDEWIPLLDPMGFPAGKSKTTVVDVPPLPEGSSELRIVTSRWLHWDRIAWSETPRDDALEVKARQLPHFASLDERGYSRLVRRAPNAPHVFDYADVTEQSPWQPMFGRYTRLGDVLPLLTAEDDRLVVLAAGDELRLRFAADSLPDVPAGHRRWVFLESVGWDKDADRNTFEATSAQPLPFRGMSGYPYAEGESYPRELEAWVEEWLTREIPAASPAVVPTGGRD